MNLIIIGIIIGVIISIIIKYKKFKEEGETDDILLIWALLIYYRLNTWFWIFKKK